ncbi:dTMP kinase [Nodosilinea sp. P-1105]|uniref:dTMP kinase n=1 Tax=Nodosilinea sp. P-1105 TaxID=2546229 RepID=UPI00146B9A7D|nr:dTMP kinase [Nodosilinea sp. P-1105]NMF82366.1 dTMP kinase [Nodosilinea sp. P-1105]
MQGKLIVFEGVEGCGKSTQLQALAKQLTAPEGRITTPGYPEGVPIITTREPGGTLLGGELRQLLLGRAMASPTELLLYAADRAQHVEEVIRPALAAGHWVLCDRFIDSTVAYQGYGRGLDLALIQLLNQVATGGLTPDLTLWLQLDVAMGLSRTRQRGDNDRIEQADLAFHQRVQLGFETLAQQHPERIVPIDAAHPPAAVTAAIFTVVEQHLQPWPNRLQT